MDFIPPPPVSGPIGIYVNTKTAEQILAWEVRGGWFFDGGWDRPRFTIVPPTKWGWEFVDYFRGSVEYFEEQPIIDITKRFGLGE